ncbi:SpnB-like Rossmann fold domain-containing protein, partial [Mycobacterium kansasii]
MQAWLGQPELAGARLVFVTHKAVAVDDAETPQLALAGVDGLVRSAASEHPGRFGLLDIDDSAASEQAVLAAVSLE